MSGFNEEDAQLAVKHGIYWLDENHPGWVTKIDLSRLRMNSCHSCVIGQAIGSFFDAIATASNTAPFSDESDEWAVEKGFQAPMNNADESTFREIGYYDYLETLWTDEVKRRLG